MFLKMVCAVGSLYWMIVGACSWFIMLPKLVLEADSLNVVHVMNGKISWRLPKLEGCQELFGPSRVNGVNHVSVSFNEMAFC